MGMGYGYGEPKDQFIERRKEKLALRLARLVGKWRDDVAYMRSSGAAEDDPVIDYIAMARTVDADEIEAILAQKKPGRPKGSKNKAKA